MKIDWKTCFRLGTSAFLLFLAISFWPTASSFLISIVNAAAPLLIGCLVAYLVNILMSFYEQHYPKNLSGGIFQLRRTVCLFLAVLTLVAVIALIFWLVLPQLGNCIRLLLAELPSAVDALLSKLGTIEWIPDDLTKILLTEDWEKQITKLLDLLMTGIGGAMGLVTTAVTSVFSMVVTALLSFIFALYLLLSKERLARQFGRVFRSYLRPAWYKKMLYLLQVLDDCFHRYIVGQCLEAVILGVLCTTGMFIFRFPYAAMIGALVAFTALIPVAGAYIGAGVGAFMMLTVSPVKSLLFLLFIVILQQLEGNLIYPKVVGSSIGLPGLWVLAAVTVGGGLMGILGMLLAVPLFAAAYRLLRENINHREALARTRSEDQQIQEDP